jgi:hypothetical protein
MFVGLPAEPGFHCAHLFQGFSRDFYPESHQMNPNFRMKTGNRALIRAALLPPRIAVTANCGSGQPSTGSSAVPLLRETIKASTDHVGISGE